MTDSDNKSIEQLASEKNIDNLINELDPLQSESASDLGFDGAVTVTDVKTSLAGLLGVAPLMLGIVGYKRAAAVWSPQAIESLSAALVPVLEKYTWGQRIIEFLRSGNGVEEAALFFVVWPLAGATYAAVQLDKADIAEKAEKESKEHEPANG